MRRFFVSREQLRGTPPTQVELTGSDVKHIRDVLRMRVGEELLVCDSAGVEYFCTLETILPDRLLLHIQSQRQGETEPLIPVILYQGIPKGEKMDWVIQKAVELGVRRIVPVMMERSVVRLPQEKDRRKKQERWQKIAHEAAKQCGRTRLPQVEIPLSYQEALADSPEGLRLLPYENEEQVSLQSRLRPLCASQSMCPISVLIGPEGGFSQEEVVFAEHAGFLRVTLGRRILRTETAGLSVLAAIRYEWQD